LKKTLVDLTYYSFPHQDSNQVLETCYSTVGFLEEISKNCNTFFLVRSEFELEPTQKGSIQVFFFKGKQLKKWQIPFRFNAFAKSLKPNYILAHGFGFAHYLILLKLSCRSSKILLQCNGYAPNPKGLKKVAYKIADFFIDGYLFTGIENAALWYEAGVFKKSKVFDVMEGSTHFKFDEKQIRKEKSYLWVADLIALKDPLTVLQAFDAFIDAEPGATLTMIYNQSDLMNIVLKFLSIHEKLKKNVNLLGFVPHASLEDIYNQHQFFVTASHQEGSGYALVESMACGCVPIVTNIASHRYMTDNGNCGLLFSPRNDKELRDQLIFSQQIDYKKHQDLVLKQFGNKLSFKAIGARIHEIFDSL
jgi:glycosyltransferase involved in cell wall biosynthesis